MKSISDDILQKVTGQIFLSYGVLLSYKYGIFKHLCKSPLTINEISKIIKLEPRCIQALLSCSGAMGFVKIQDEKYELSEYGHMFFDPSSQYFYGPVFDLYLENPDLLSVETVEKSILKDSSQLNSSAPLFSNKNCLSNEHSFTSALHAKSLIPASSWVNKIDLESHQIFVDIGCGSGVHTLAACEKFSHLTAIACDRNPVLKHLKQRISNSSLRNRIELHEIDIWTNDFPKGDVIFLGDIFHDWSMSKCQKIAKKAYSSLRKGGKIIVHEILFDDSKTSPDIASAYNMKMIMWTEGQQFSFNEIKDILSSAGFKNIEKTDTIGSWSIVTGEKLSYSK